MPWQGVTPVDLRLEFNHAYRSGLCSMTELCDHTASAARPATNGSRATKPTAARAWSIDRGARTRVRVRPIPRLSSNCVRRVVAIPRGVRAS
jgi:hypothetical protein